MNKIKQWFSIRLAKNPGGVVLTAILIFNLLLFILAAFVISALSLEGTEKMSFIEAAFCTVTMILDAGCIQFVISDIGESGLFITVFCLCVVLVGMITFTGAVIGYVTNYISGFVDHANAGKRKLTLSGHYVILNWNGRASEIVNDMLYADHTQKLVVLTQTDKETVEKEIEERLSDTVSKENKLVAARYSHLPFLARIFAVWVCRFRKKVVVIVRQGDVFSSKQLNDISLDKAKAVIILGNDVNRNGSAADAQLRNSISERGNTLTIKTLMQVADITAAEASAENQKIVVEITDPWTLELVNQIIAAKQVDGKCNIVPVRVNVVLGQLLAQFCLMPELNSVYSELFSNRGAEIYSVERPYTDEKSFIGEFLQEHNHALPLATAQEHGKGYAYYVACRDKDILKRSQVKPLRHTVTLNEDYWAEGKTVIILGHNSKSKYIMAGFDAYRNEWNRPGQEILQLVVIDDRESLEKMNYYREYPFVVETVAAEVYDKELICETIDRVVAANTEDTSVLILSDDTAAAEAADAGALANLVYVRDIIRKKLCQEPDFDPQSIDVIVEIIDPKHHDIVSNYSVNNVVISNRYISKMITQISEFEALYKFYCDILTYDEAGAESYHSKEIYIKKANAYFGVLPEEMTADQFVRAVYAASVKAGNPTMALGYITPETGKVFFEGDLTQISVKLGEKDKLILFSAH